MSFKDLLWVEKYRPKNLDALVLEEETKKRIQSWLESKNIPHLMLVGRPGTGKTTLAKILIDQLGFDYLELNASDDRGINVIRDKVKLFLQTEGILGSRHKIVFFDEADRLTSEAQDILRRIMEDYSDVGRMIFSLNYFNKISDALISRCTVIEFKPLSTKQQVKLFKAILEKERISYEVEELLKLADFCNGDLRKAIGILQRDSASGSFKFSKELIGINLDLILELAKKNQWKKLMQYIYGFNTFDRVYRDLFEYVWSLQNERAIALVGEYMYRDSVVYDRQINFLVCIRRLISYLV